MSGHLRGVRARSSRRAPSRLRPAEAPSWRPRTGQFGCRWHTPTGLTHMSIYTCGSAATGTLGTVPRATARPPIAVLPHGLAGRAQPQRPPFAAIGHPVPRVGCVGASVGPRHTRTDRARLPRSWRPRPGCSGCSFAWMIDGRLPCGREAPPWTWRIPTAIAELALEHAMSPSATFDRSTRRPAGTRHGLTDRSISPDTIIDTHITTARARLYHHDRAIEGETIDRPTLP